MAQLPRVGDRLGRYRIDDQIGFGGMGVVYGATDLDLGRRVAIKVVSGSLGNSDEFVRRFEREAALLARLASPHVIGVYDYGEHDGNPFIVTQYVGGGDLGQLLKKRGPMPPALAASVCAQVAEALADTHRLGVIHRDVKPSNVLLRDPEEPRLQAYLCDFGIARTATDGITVAGGIAGTWGYLAPEVGLGRPASPQSDIYALGCVLWAALTGTAPYSGSDLEVALAHQQAPIPQLAETHPYARHANQILTRCLAKTPDQRYPDADTLDTDLQALTHQPAGPITPIHQQPPRALSGGRSNSRTGGSFSSGTPTPTPSFAGSGVRPATRAGRHSSAHPGYAYPGAPRRRRTALIAAAAVAGVLVLGGGAALAVTKPWDGSSEPSSHDSDTPPPSGSGHETSASSTASAPKGPIAGDLDSDGHGDVVLDQMLSTGARYNSVTTVLGSDGRRLVKQAPTTVAVPKDAWDEILVADFDGDGKPELARVRYPGGGYRLTVSAQLSGGGSLQGSATVPGTQKYDGVLAASDVDGDGRADLVMYRASQDENTDYNNWSGRVTISVALNAGTSIGAPKVIGQVPLRGGDYESEISVADVTGDKRADVVVAQVKPGFASKDDKMRAELSVYPGGPSSLGAPSTVTYTANNGYAEGLLTGDVDGDGRADVVLLDDETAVTVRVAKFTTGLQRPQVWGAIDSYGSDFALSDVNGDGTSDLVYLDDNKKGMVVHVSLSAHGQFAPGTPWVRLPKPTADRHYESLAKQGSGL